MTKNTKQKPNTDKDAAEIFLGVQRNRAGVDEWEDYKSFVDKCPENAAEQKSLETIWCDAGHLSNDLLPSAEELASDTYEGEETVEAFLASAHQDHLPKPSTNLGAVVSSFEAFFRGMFLRPAFGVVALLLVAFVTVSMWPGDAALRYNTGIAEHRRLALEDGSFIMLGAKSEVVVHYQDMRRSVILISGEAYFDVAKDKNRPFVVDVNGLHVQAVGTAFNILHTPEKVQVSVTEGIVRVEAEAENVSIGNSTATLEVGDALKVSKVTNSFEQSEEDPSRMLFWQNDILYFQGEQLKDIIYRIDRYTTQSVVLADPAAGELLFSGSINRNNIASWLNSLPLAFPVTLERVGDQITIAPKAS